MVCRSQIATARRLIKEKGETVTWTQVLSSGFTDNRGWKPSGASNNIFTVDLVFVPSGADGEEYKFFDPSRSGGFVIAYMPPVSFEPALTDYVTRTDGTVFGIKFLDVIQPSSEIILWRMGLMR